MGFNSANQTSPRTIGRRRFGQRAAASLALLVVSICATQPGAATTISLAGIDYYRLCRDTERVPLVQAAIDPAYINVWTTQESERAGRFEQYSFASKRIDVRAEHEISLYHGLIHRTLDLIGESEWKHRDLAPHEDREHWLIYYTLETHWPGAQWRQGREPSPATLLHASRYWRQYAERYAEIAAKAASLAAKSWCAANREALEAQAMRPPAQPPRPKLQTMRPISSPMATAAASGAPNAAPEPALTARSTARPVAPAGLRLEPTRITSESLQLPAANLGAKPVSPWESQWASSPTDLPAIPR